MNLLWLIVPMFLAVWHVASCFREGLDHLRSCEDRRFARLEASVVQNRNDTREELRAIAGALTSMATKFGTEARTTGHNFTHVHAVMDGQREDSRRTRETLNKILSNTNDTEVIVRTLLPDRSAVDLELSM